MLVINVSFCVVSKGSLCAQGFCTSVLRFHGSYCAFLFTLNELPVRLYNAIIVVSKNNNRISNYSIIIMDFFYFYRSILYRSFLINVRLIYKGRDV